MRVLLSALWVASERGTDGGIRSAGEGIRRGDQGMGWVCLDLRDAAGGRR
jgi:hypothetical protein